MFNTDERKVMEAEGRERNFARERDTLSVGTRDDFESIRMQESRTDLLHWQQDLSDEMLNLKMRLRGFELGPDGHWTQKVVKLIYADGKQKEIPSNPLCNELFIDYIEVQVEPFLSRNLFNTNYDEKRILQILKNTCDDICNAMADCWDQFEISFCNYDLVLRLIKNTIIPGPFRALNDGQRRHDRSIIKRIEATNENLSPERKKLLGVFN